MQGKKLYLIIAAVVVLLLAGAGTYYVLSQKQAPEIVTQSSPSQQVLTLSPDQIGLQVAFRPDNKALKFTISNPQGITSVDYTISYVADQKGQQVNQGLIGTLIPDPNASSWSTDYREFGTCSSGVCRYDTVVSPITLTLKIQKTDGKVYQVVKTVTLPQS